MLKYRYKLKIDVRPEFKLLRAVYIPWGKYDSIDNGERYQVKRIKLKPSNALSYVRTLDCCI